MTTIKIEGRKGSMISSCWLWHKTHSTKGKNFFSFFNLSYRFSILFLFILSTNPFLTWNSIKFIKVYQFFELTLAWNIFYSNFSFCFADFSLFHLFWHQKKFFFSFVIFFILFFSTQKASSVFFFCVSSLWRFW